MTTMTTLPSPRTGYLCAKRNAPVIKSLVPAVLWLIAITFLSTRGTVSMPRFNLIGADKFGHAMAYGLLVWLILLGISRVKSCDSFSHRLGVFLFATGYGILMEFVQANFFPGRFFEYDDMLANAIGAVIGWLVFVRLFPTLDPIRRNGFLHRLGKIVNRKS